MIVEFAKGGAFLLALCSIQGLISYRWPRNEAAGQIASGVAFGAICIIGMMTPIVISPGVIFDARSVILAVAGFFGGPVAGVIAGAIAGGFRLWLGGPGAGVGLGVVFTCVAFGLVYREAARRGWVRTGFAELMGFGLVVHLATLGLFTFLPPPVFDKVISDIAVPMLIVFTPATAVLGWLLKLIAEHSRDRQSLEETNLRFRELTENIRDAFFMVTPSRDRVIYMSPAYEEIWGRSCAELYADPWSYLRVVHPDDVEAVKEIVHRNKFSEYQQTYRIVRPDQSLRTVRVKAFPVRNARGDVYRIAGIAEDITELVDRDEQLRQAQKMEALGQLTGGVAHDFNNLLQIIQGNAEVLDEQVAPDNPSLDAILRASRRGSELTQRLLTFARKQTLSATAIDVPVLVDRVTALLHRTLGPEVQVLTNFESGVWPVHADPGQLENALVNLAINARDAMEAKGTVTFTCGNCAVSDDEAVLEDRPGPGDYVCIKVSDDGPGMPEAVRQKAFEPFFTTKEAGRGSGLGLSMVYGFAKQSGGTACIDTREGGGTTVTLYLPRSEAGAPAEIPAPERTETGPRSHTILVVEDDPDVRALALNKLVSLGYDAIGAENTEMALERLDGPVPVDGLLCDVVLAGGGSGPELAGKAKARMPGLRIAFMSGYPEDAGADIHALGDAFLAKPFRKRDLERAIDEMLD